MALTETTAYKVEVNENFSIGVRRADIILKDGTEIARSYHRAVFSPGSDLSDQVQEVRDIANAVWTEQVIADYEASLPVEEVEVPTTLPAPVGEETAPM